MPDGTVKDGTCDFDTNTTDSNAKASEILEGQKAYVQKNQVTGTMKNNGAVAGYISKADAPYTVPQGYHDGSGKVSIDPTELGKLIAENIRKGISILGVEGTMDTTEGVKPQKKTITPSGVNQTITADQPDYNYLSEVVVLAIPYSEEANALGTTVIIGAAATT